MLTGGRLTAEDAYAYAKFARVALGTNDIDFRARPHSAEEAGVPGRRTSCCGPTAVTYADLEAAGPSCWPGSSPRTRPATIFLRLRKAARHGGTQVVSLAPYTSRGLRKMAGRWSPTAPGDEAAALDGAGPRRRASALDSDAVILVGERLATVPGALTAAADAGRAPPAPGWPGCRAAPVTAARSRPAACPTLLPGGRPVADAAARVDVATAWGVEHLPETAGRDADAIVAALAAGELGGLVVGGVDPDDTADPAAARAAHRARPASWSASSCARPRSPGPPTWCSRSRR